MRPCRALGRLNEPMSAGAGKGTWHLLHTVQVTNGTGTGPFRIPVHRGTMLWEQRGDSVCREGGRVGVPLLPGWEALCGWCFCGQMVTPADGRPWLPGQGPGTA